jgi:SAM-dependent methyltransferase
MTMGGTSALLKTFLNTSLFPFGWRLVRSAALLEFPREYLALLDDDPALGHSHLRCTCGSDKVVNFGMPRNNGRYFFCRTCERSFQASVHRREWTELYRAQSVMNPTGASWLESHEPLLRASSNRPIMDLGCGCGDDTVYLRQRGFDTVSCDYSEEALRRLSGLAHGAKTACLDMADGLPFPPGAFKAVVANLSLHYFSWHDTERIVADIHRVLADDGCLLCRVNSVADTEHGAGQGIRIEEHFYNVGGKHKRFFDKEQLARLFRGWELLLCAERRLTRTGKTKVFWEVVVRKR